MQVQLTREEFELLQQILQDQDRLSEGEASSLSPATFDAWPRDKLQIGRDLFGLGPSRNLQLDFEELENLADFLRWRKSRMAAKNGSSADPQSDSLPHELVILEHLLEKVTEACAMV